MPRGSTKVKTTTVEEKEIPIDEQAPVVDLQNQADPVRIESIIPFPEQGTSPEEDDLKKYFAGLGGSEVVVKIYKYDAATNRPRFMQDTDIEGASEASIQTNWGEGKYLLRGYKEGSVVGSKTAYIGPPLQKNLPAPSIAPVIVPAPAGNDGIVALQIEMLKEESRMNRDLMLKMIEKMGNNGNEKSGATELAEIMVMLKPVLTPAAAAAGGNVMSLISEALPVIKQLIELGASGGERKESWLSTIKDLAPDVLGAVKALAMTKMNPMMPDAPPVQPVQPYPQPTAPAQVVAAPEVPGLTPERLALVRGYLQFLKVRARQHANPDTFINFILDTLDMDQSMAIAQLLERPYEDIGVLDPELLTPVYRPWFEDFFGGLKDALSERDTTGGEGSNAPDPAANAPTDDSGGPVRSTDQATGD